jgi:PST family polysaccharide transporter
VFLMALSCVQPVIAFIRDFLFALWLTPSQLGQWGVAFSYITLAAPLAILGITGSFGRYLDHYRQRGHLQTFLRRTGLACAVLTIVAVCAIQSSAPWFSALVFNTADHTLLIEQMTFCLIGMILYGYVVESLTALRLFRIVSVLHFVKGILFATLGLSLLAMWQLSASSIIIAHGVACFVTSAVALRWLLPACFAEDTQQTTALPHSQLWRKLLPFAFGIWIVNALANLFSMIDRYMLVHHGGMSPIEAMTEIGYYQSSRMVPLLFIGFAGMLGSMTLPHLTHDWERGKQDHVSRTLHLSIKIFALALLAGGTVLIVGAPLLYHVGLEGKYDGGLAVLPWTTIYCAWFSLNVLVELYLFCSEKSYMSAVALGIGLIANVALNLVLLPILGLEGAVLATAAATFAVLAIGFALSHRMGLTVDVRTWILVLLMPALALGPWGASIVLLAVLVIVAQTNWLLSHDEKQTLQTVLGGYADKALRILRRS